MSKCKYKDSKLDDAVEECEAIMLALEYEYELKRENAKKSHSHRKVNDNA